MVKCFFDQFVECHLRSRFSLLTQTFVEGAEGSGAEGKVIQNGEGGCSQLRALNPGTSMVLFQEQERGWGM